MNELDTRRAARRARRRTTMERAPELAEIIKAWFEAAAKGDVSWRDRHVSRQPGMRIIGTDPDELLEGERAYAFLKNEAEAAGGKLQVSVGHVEAFKEGSVGWGLAIPTITFPDGKKLTPRWSAVFHIEDGQWRLVQLHASFAKANTETFGDTLPGAPAK
jgi:adenylate cyclase